MICIYKKDETEFNSLGLGALLPTSCKVKEEENGIYSLTLKHSRDKQGKWKRLQEGRIILAPTPDKNQPLQPFRIFHINPDMKEITVEANHIFYDLLDNFVIRAESKNQTADSYLQTLKNAFEYPTPFSFSSDIQKTDSFFIEKSNPVFCLLGEAKEEKGEQKQKSFVQAYGGQIYRNRFSVTINQIRGNDTGVLIAYKKNLLGLKVDEDYAEVATRIYPYDGDNGIPEKYIDSPNISKYAHPKIRKLEVKDDKDPKQAVKEFYNAGGDLPKINIKVDFLELSKTEEYKNFKALLSVYLGDLVTVYNPVMDFQKKAKIISYEYDSILQKYDKIELGDFIPTIYKPITSGVSSSSAATSAKAESSSVMALLDAHLKDFNNPHKVTAEQTGAGEGGGTVDLTEINKKLSEHETKITNNTTAIADQQKALQSHLQDYNNPHKVTAEQIGGGSGGGGGVAPDISGLESKVNSHLQDFNNPHKNPDILSGSGVPSAGNGMDGDIYINFNAKFGQKSLFLKRNGSWDGIV